jgi:TPR repeat protein
LNALGAIYEGGKYVPKDLRKALKFYKEAEKLNSSEAMHRIGLFLEKGLINSK